MADLLMQMKDLVIEADIDGKWKSIVNGLSLDLHKGEIVGLIGESGAGKSTLGLAAMGYTKPGCRITSGSILLNQEELVGASHSARFAETMCLMLRKAQPLRSTQHTD